MPVEGPSVDVLSALIISKEIMRSQSFVWNVQGQGMFNLLHLSSTGKNLTWT